MKKIIRDFISEENREYKFRFGHLLASSLSGFIAGVVSATIVWMIALQYVQFLQGY